MNKTKIDWATMSWNPLTGCRHGCPYCYARRTAHRFGKGLEDPAQLPGGLHILEKKIKATPYPYGFEPTLHRYRLDQPDPPRKEENDLIGPYYDVPLCRGCYSREICVRRKTVCNARARL